MAVTANRVAIIVSFNLPPGVSRRDAESYVRQAVNSYKRSWHLGIDDPIAELDGATLDVRLARGPRRESEVGHGSG